MTFLSYDSLIFDEDGFWDSEQYENILPIQFWKEDVPSQEYLDVLLLAWQDIGVDISMVLGDPNDFEDVIKRVFHNEHYWMVWWNGNMSIEKIELLGNTPQPLVIDS